MSLRISHDIKFVFTFTVFHLEIRGMLSYYTIFPLTEMYLFNVKCSFCPFLLAEGLKAEGVGIPPPPNPAQVLPKPIDPHNGREPVHADPPRHRQSEY